MEGKLTTFVHTEKGMLTSESRRGDYILRNEMLGVLNEEICGKQRVLTGYSDESDPRKNDDWFKAAKAKYEGQLELLEYLRKMLY